MSDAWAKHDDDKKIGEYRRELEMLRAEVLDLTRDREQLRGALARLGSGADTIDCQGCQDLIRERDLTMPKLNNLYRQADCSHPGVVDRLCCECGRELLTDVYLERAWSFMESRKPYPGQSVDWVGVRRLAGLLRDVGGCSEMEQESAHTKVVSRNLVREIVAPTQMGLCVACGYMRPLLQTDIND